MTNAHPLIWLVIVAAAMLAALTLADPAALALLVAGLLTAGFLARGPRLASFAYACVAAAAIAATWMLWTLLLPGAAPGGQQLFTLPTWSAGTGTSFGGIVTTDAVERGTVGALAAAVLVLALGLAGQVVSARSWLSLARLTGPLAPAFGWIATAGESAAEVASQRRQRRGLPALVVWFRASRDLARDLPGVTPRLLLQWRNNDLAQAIAAAAWLAAVALSGHVGIVGIAAAAACLPLSIVISVPRRRHCHA